MSANNKARRAAKAKQKARQRRSGRPTPPRESFEFGFDVGPLAPPTAGERAASALIAIESLCWSWLDRLGPRDFVKNSRLLALVADLAATGMPAADDALDACLGAHLGRVWEAGWQPAELVREARRSGTPSSARLVELLVLDTEQRRSGVGLDPRWAAQVADLALRDVSLSAGWAAALRRHEGVSDPMVFCRDAVLALRLLTGLPTLDVLIPPPGAAADSVRTFGGAAADVALDSPVLRRVRKLLAKAEATTFESEAEALTAKAQELIARHAIDQALVEPTDSGGGPVMTRLPVDAPYADAKSVLLSVVATAHRCRAISYPSLGLVTVVGYPADQRVVDLLFTSLLVQAQNALNETARGSGAGSRPRSPSFRASFYIGFAHRIGERLESVNQAVFAEAETAGSSAVLVLRDREEEVEAFFDERFAGSMTTSRIRGSYDWAGQNAGRLAAEQARFDSGQLTG